MNRMRFSIVGAILSQAGSVFVMTAKKRGGRRPGSGRKMVTKDPVRLAINVEREDLEVLKAKAKDRDISMAEFIRRGLHRLAKRR